MLFIRCSIPYLSRTFGGRSLGSKFDGSDDIGGRSSSMGKEEVSRQAKCGLAAAALWLRQNGSRGSCAKLYGDPCVAHPLPNLLFSITITHQPPSTTTPAINHHLHYTHCTSCRHSLIALVSCFHPPVFASSSSVSVHHPCDFIRLPTRGPLSSLCSKYWLWPSRGRSVSLL